LIRSSLQNCEEINFCYFKPPSLWYFVKAVGGDLYKHHDALYVN